jgi:hypothetical protein
VGPWLDLLKRFFQKLVNAAHTVVEQALRSSSELCTLRSQHVFFIDLISLNQANQLSIDT